MIPIALVDPALGHSGGHHLAALHTLKVELGSDLIAVLGSTTNAEEVKSILKSGFARPTYHQSFTQPFYFLARGASWFKVRSYVRRMASEYLQAIGSTDAAIYLHHTMSWEHAQALALALSHFKTRQLAGDAVHIVFATFNPGLDDKLRVINRKELARFRNSFKALISHDCVKLYTSCAEYAYKYQHLLSLPDPVAIHPVFFDEVFDSSAKPASGSAEILYFGDAKREKGFHRLPGLLTQKINGPGAKSLIVHYTEVLDPSLLGAEATLLNIARDRTNLRLLRGYLDATEVDTLFSSATCLILDYDIAEYSQKTSGALWLAMRRNLSIEAPAGTWMQREAEKLTISENDSEGRHAEVIAYRESIFRSFGTWLNEVAEGASR